MISASYLSQRIAKIILVMFALIVTSFVLIRLAPGDPALVLAGELGASDKIFLEQIRHQFGLDRPIHEQLLVYLSNVLSLDFGDSYTYKLPVAHLILQRVPATLLLTGTAFLFALVVGVSLGVLAASRAGSWIDTGVTGFSLIGWCMPNFWLGMIFILVFASKLGWFPTFGMTTIQAKFTGWHHVADVLHHLVLPMVVLGFVYVAIYARLTRAAMLEVKNLDFVRTAKAGGLSPFRTNMHVLRNGLLPVLTAAGLQAGHLIGGSLIVESVYAWPGIGRLAFEAVQQRDFNLILGVLFATSFMVLVINFLIDLAYTMVDPRVELHS